MDIGIAECVPEEKIGAYLDVMQHIVTTPVHCILDLIDVRIRLVDQ